MAQQRETELQPYETTLDVTLPDPFATSRSWTSEDALMAAENGKRDKLPWYFPRIRPAIAGVVMHIESKEEIFNDPDIFASLAMLLVEFLWILVNIQQERENDRVVVTTVRIQTFDGQLRDARLRGNMRGADMALGDQVLLWGIKRRGVLLVRRGFNRTSQGVISTNAAGLLLPVLITAVGLAVLVILVPSWFPVITQIFTTFFNMYTFIFQHHTH
ncbi:hypothetical protein KDAU_08150 [Dictyobacter aurantiacus]|uniref:Uncharacterized protein n=1 Tax=Dictyobacter aurantiacus TaxID=1936993 RepID=A0A401Z9L3_9CHLR|nr:hypothetical protein KDAU_08150 [Dictyobacter aurantiacus]